MTEIKKEQVDMKYSGNDWVILTDKVGLVYLFMSGINFVFSFIISIFCMLQYSYLYLIPAILMVFLMGIVVYFFIKRNDIIRILNIIFIIVGFYWITEAIGIFPQLLVGIIFSIVELVFLIINYFISRSLDRR